MTLQEIDSNFTIYDLIDEQQPLSQKEAHDGLETLGVILAPDGNNKKMITKLKSKTEKWKDLITSGHITSSCTPST